MWQDEEFDISEEEWKEYQDKSAKFEIVDMFGQTIIHSEPERWISVNDLMYVLDKAIKGKEEDVLNCDDDEIKKAKLEGCIFMMKKIKEVVINDMWYFQAAFWEIKDF